MASTSIFGVSDFSGAFPDPLLLFPVFELSLDDDDVAVVAVVDAVTVLVEDVKGLASRDLLLPSDLTLAALDGAVVESCKVDLIFSFEWQFRQFTISGTVVKLTDISN